MSRAVTSRRSWRRLAAVGLLAVLGLQVGCATLDERQRDWIFQPGDRTWAGGLAAAQGMEDVWIAFDSRVDYRGFGRSSAGLPSEAMAAEDARAAWDWLARQHPAQRRFIFGHSLGGAIAVQLASEVGDEDGLIVEGSFTSIPDVVSTFRWGWLPVSPLITQRFDAASRVADIGSPLLVVHGSQDSLIPHRLGQAQYREALAELFALR